MCVSLHVCMFVINHRCVLKQTSVYIAGKHKDSHFLLLYNEALVVIYVSIDMDIQGELDFTQPMIFIVLLFKVRT